MRKLNLKPVLALLLASLLLVVVVQPAAADDTTEVLTTRWSGTGSYGIVAQGVGMHGATTGDILGLNVPGTVVAAYLYWEGHDNRYQVPDPDDTVDLSVDGGLAVTLTADGTYGPLLWYGSFDRIAYWKDVTSLVLSGSHNYEVSDFSMSTNADYSQDGAGLIVVYENKALPVAYVEIKDGLDRAFRDWSGAQGETAVNCFQFDALATPRPLDLTAFVGGIDPMPSSKHGDRPNSIWYETGTGATPADMLNADVKWNRDPMPPLVLLDKVPTGQGDFALTAGDGGKWDTYTNSIVIPPGETWACFQLESSDLPDRKTGTCPGNPDLWDPVLGCCTQNAVGTNNKCLPASFAGLVLAAVVELEQPVVEEEFVPEPGTVILLASGLMGMAGYAGLRLRKK